LNASEFLQDIEKKGGFKSRNFCLAHGRMEWWPQGNRRKFHGVKILE
jgi:hypothetical protein